VVRQMSQQPTIDRIVQGKRWLETTAVCKDKGKDNVNREEEGLCVCVCVCVTETPVGVGRLQSRDVDRIARASPTWSFSY
jgi:hypothetical protein